MLLLKNLGRYVMFVNLWSNNLSCLLDESEYEVVIDIEIVATDDVTDIDLSDAAAVDVTDIGCQGVLCCCCDC